MAQGLSTFQLPSNYNFGNVGLSQNTGGGLQSANLPQVYGPANPVNFGYPNNLVSNTANTSQVLGAAVSRPAPQAQPSQTQQPQQPQNTGGGGGGGAPSGPGQNVNQFVNGYRWTGTDWAAPAINAANAGNDALLSQLNTRYDQNASNLNSQLSELGTQKGNALNELNTTYQGLSDQTNTQKTQANQNLEDQIAQAGSQAHNTQNANRNTLRALGILNSTAAGEELSKPLTAFDQQRAQLQTQTNQRLSQLDDFMNNQASVHANAVKSLEDQYGSLVNNIQNDLRFNDRQRSDAIQSANAALQQRMAEIQNSLFNYQTQVQTAKQQAAMQLAQIKAYQNPSFDPTAILSQIFQPDQGQQSSNVGIAQDPNKNNPLLSG